MKGVLLTLGAPNDDAGNLSQMAIDRLNCVLNIYTFNPDILIICTGGFGEHFNRTELPHAVHAQYYLLSKGVKKENLGEVIISNSTIEDLTLAKPVIGKLAPDVLIVVTSDFHMSRVKIIHENAIEVYRNCIFISAESKLSTAELQKLMMHEKEAIERLWERISSKT